MSIERLDIEFGATTPGLASSAREVIGSIHSVGDAAEAVKGFLSGLREGLHDVFSTPSGHLQEEFREAANEADRLGDEVRKVDEQIDRANTSAGLIGSTLKGAIAGFIAGLSVDRLREFMVAQGDMAEHLGNLSDILGVSTKDLSAWRLTAEVTGVSADTLTNAMAKMEINAVKAASGSKQQQAALDALGISAEAAKNPQEMLLQVADKFSQIEGPTRITLATELFGKSGREIIPVLEQGRQALEEQQRAMEEYGATVDEKMIQQGQEVDAVMDEQTIAFKGLSNLIFTETAPAFVRLAESMNETIKTMVESYRAGGDVKTTFEALGYAGKVLTVGVVDIGVAFYSVFFQIVGAAETLAGGVVSAFEIVRGAASVLMDDFRLLGTVIKDVLTLDWGSIASDIESGLDRIAGTVEAARKRISSGGGLYDMASGAFGRASAANNWEAGFVNNLWMEDPVKLTKPPKKEGAGDGDLDIPGLGGGGGGKKDVVGEWQKQLDMQRMATGEFLRDQSSMELEFWQGKLALTKRGTDEWYSVQEKVYALLTQRARSDFQEQTQILSGRIQAERDNYSVMKELMEQKIALVGRTYGEDSREYRAVLREKENMERQHQQELAQIAQRGAQQRAQIEQEAARGDSQIGQMRLQEEEAALRYRESAGIIGRRAAAAERAAIAQREFDLRVELEERLYQITMASLQEQLHIEGLRPQQIAQLNAQIERETAAHNTRLRVQASQQAQLIRTANTNAADAVRQVWLDRLRPVTQALTGMVNGFISGTMTLRGAVLQMGSQILQQVVSWAMESVGLHVATEQAKTASTVAGTATRTAAETGAAATSLATTAATGTAEITTNAAVAGSGALASISKIPVIGPYIAPAIAAGIMALAMGFISNVASAEGGWDRVPHDGAMTELHKDEMVLPASIATPLRDALASGSGDWGVGRTGQALARNRDDGFSSEAPAAIRQEGDTHLHVHALDAKSAHEWMIANRSTVVKAVRQAVREGASLDR